MIDIKSLMQRMREWFTSQLLEAGDEILEVLEDLDERPLSPKQREAITAHLNHVLDPVGTLRTLEADGFISLMPDDDAEVSEEAEAGWRPPSRDIIVSRRRSRQDAVRHALDELAMSSVTSRTVESKLKDEFIDPRDPSSSEADAEYALKIHLESTFLDSIRRHLKQVEKIKALSPSPEASAVPGEDPSAPWGRYAFGPERVGVPDEPNTDDEESVLYNIRDHIQADMKLSQRTASEIQDLIRRGMYTDILELDSEQHPVVYRGMAIKRQALVGLLDMTGEDSLEELTRPGQIIDVNMIFSPRHSQATASWTTSLSEARRFARSSDDYSSDGCRVVFYARTSQNPGSFILNPDELYSILPIKNFAHEQETIGVGPIRVFRVEFLQRGERSKKNPSRTKAWPF